MDSSCVGGNVSPSDMSGSSSHTSPQPPGCQMNEHLTGETERPEALSQTHSSHDDPKILNVGSSSDTEELDDIKSGVPHRAEVKSEEQEGLSQSVSKTADDTHDPPGSIFALLINYKNKDDC